MAAMAAKADKTAIWDSVLKDTTMPDDQKVEAKELLYKLAFFDSIHDFFKERGGKAVTDEDSTEPVAMRKERMDAVKTNLVDSIQKYVALPEKPLESILQEKTGNAVSSTSSIEDKVLAYFKRKHKPFNQQEQYMTVSQILSEWKFNNNWKEYSAAIKSLPDSLEITIDVPNIKSLDDSQRGTIGFFLLAFMDPNVQPGKEEKFLTFDMPPGSIGQIFTRFEQVYNAVYPQNISDSAPTSFNALLGRNKFFRADYSPAGGTAKIIKQVRSNAFTKGKYTIQFVDEGFGPKKKFGFFVEILDAKNQSIGQINFKEGSSEQGPSVNYLMDIIYEKKIEGVSAASKVAKLDKLTVYDKDLLFDLKRMGDQEQMMVTSAYGITGDRFAGAFRRILRKPGVYQSTKGFKVWRAPLNAAGMEAQAVDFQREQVIEKLKIISAILSSKPGSITDLHQQLLQMKAQVIKAGKVGYIRRPPIEGILDKIGDRKFVAENYTQIAATVVTYILRLRMRDILEQIDDILKKIEGMTGKIPEVVKAACSQKMPSPDPNTACPPPADLAGITVEGALETLETFINEIKGLKEMTIAFTPTIKEGKASKKREPIYVPLFDENDKLIKGSSSALFNFSAAPFTHSEEGLGPVIAELLFLSTSTRITPAVERKVKSLLVDYFHSRDQIKEAFFNEKEKTQLENFTDITTDLPPSNVVTANTDGRQGLIEVIKNIIKDGEARTKADRGIAVVAQAAATVAAEKEAKAAAAKATVVAPGSQAGGADEQKVATWSPLQYRDLHDLFAELCLDASLAIELNFDVNKPAERNIPNLVSALDDIEINWITGVNGLRTNAQEDYYGKVFEESVTTDIISYLLSKRSNTTSVFVPEKAEIGRRDEKWIKDIEEVISNNDKKEEKVEVETFILCILATFSNNIIEEDPATGKLVSKYAARNQWLNVLPGTLIALGTSINTGTLAEQVVKLVKGGGGLEEAEETTANVPDNATGSSRRRLYEGLRKRGGSGSSTEL